MILFQKTFSQKLTALILVISLVSLVVGPILLYPRKAQAVCSVRVTSSTPQQKGNTIFNAFKALWSAWSKGNLSELTKQTAKLLWDQAKKLVTWALGVALNLLLHQILAELTNDIVAWIQNGETPRFLSGNLSDWLEDAADKAAGAFITQYLGAGWLCETFDIDIQGALLKVPTFEEGVKCSLSDMVANIKGFYGNFSQGGWKGWVELTKPRNNLYGAYLLAQAEKMTVEERAEAEREKELEMGEGYLSPKNCTWYDKTGRLVTIQEDVWGSPSLPSECQPDSNNPGWTIGGFAAPCYHKCTIYTPASTVKAVTDKAVTNYFDQINAQIAAAASKAGPYAVYVQAIISALINRVLQEGMGLLLAEAVPDPIDVPGAQPPPIADPTDVLLEQDQAQTLLVELKNLKESLETRLLPEQQETLTAYEVVLEAYPTAIPALNDMLSICRLTEIGYGMGYVQWGESWINTINNEKIPWLEQGIAQTQLDIQQTLDTIDLVDTAIASVENFITEANEWLDVYEKVGGIATDPELIAATGELDAARAAAIEDVQEAVAAINGVALSDDFLGLTDEVRQAYTNVINQAFDLEDERGEPDSQETGTIYYELALIADIKSQASEMTTICIIFGF